VSGALRLRSGQLNNEQQHPTAPEVAIATSKNMTKATNGVILEKKPAKL